MRFLQATLLSIMFLSGCVPCDPQAVAVGYCPRQDIIKKRKSPFAPLNDKEFQESWGKEYTVAKGFAREGDYYRALTACKRAFFLIPPAHVRRLELEFFMIEIYYLAGKWRDAVDVFESGDLQNVEASFPASDDLLIMLADSYLRLGNLAKRDFFLSLLDARSKEKALSLKLGEALIYSDWEEAVPLFEKHPCSCRLYEFQSDYYKMMKSPETAGFLNAILPGAGYLYVGQTNTAITSFLLNTLFTAAAYQCFDHGYIPAGIILTSFELGWWLGGINGARIAAREYNDCYYHDAARATLADCRLFPVLMLEWGF